MAKFVKVILFLLLTVALHGIVSDIFIEKMEQVEFASALPISHQEEIGAPEYPYFPIAELTNNIQGHQVSMSRIQRAQVGEYFFLLKNILLNWAERESILSQHRGKIYATTISCYCQSACEYYVFTLRHIII